MKRFQNSNDQKEKFQNQQQNANEKIKVEHEVNQTHENKANDQVAVNEKKLGK